MNVILLYNVIGDVPAVQALYEYFMFVFIFILFSYLMQ